MPKKKRKGPCTSRTRVEHFRDGDYIRAGTHVTTPRMPDIVFEIERDASGWTIQSGPVTEEVDFLIGLESMDFQWVGGGPVEAPDLCVEFDDVVDRLRQRFMELDQTEQARIVSTLWDHT